MSTTTPERRHGAGPVPGPDELDTVERQVMEAHDALEDVAIRVTRAAEAAEDYEPDKSGEFASRERIGDLAMFIHWVRLLAKDIVRDADRIESHLSTLDLARIARSEKDNGGEA